MWRRDLPHDRSTGLNVSDYARSKAFYVNALAPLGYAIIMELPPHIADPDGHNIEAVCHDPS
jgi:hypothetical protein